MFCKKCGSSISTEAKFCRSCGFKLNEPQGLSVTPEPVVPAAIAPAPVEPAPVEPAPATATPVTPEPVVPAAIAPAPVEPKLKQKELNERAKNENEFPIPKSFRTNTQANNNEIEKKYKTPNKKVLFSTITFLAVTVISGGGYFFWEQQKAQEQAIKIAKQEAELSKKQAQEALQLAEVEKLKAAEAKKEFELAQEQANESQKQIDIAKKLALEAQQKAETQSRLTLAAKEQAENEKRRADELAQQLARQSATAQRNSNATISWTGYLTCSRGLAQYSTNTDRFTKKININTNAGKGTAVLRANDTTEKYTLEITANNVRLYSDGYFNNDRSKAWIITTEGKLTGSNINTSGAMLTSDGKNTIREMCQFSLAQY